MEEEEEKNLKQMTDYGQEEKKIRKYGR
jgi:hypothetical protein